MEKTYSKPEIQIYAIKPQAVTTITVSSEEVSDEIPVALPFVWFRR